MVRVLNRQSDDPEYVIVIQRALLRHGWVPVCGTLPRPRRVRLRDAHREFEAGRPTSTPASTLYVMT